ncbi:MAG: hybrid sensor histidine kinase/response regulator [Anaerolineae bacterium]|nr:hybrid sensor histidine kinase/response regulator [Anaerolineae bacterium]
METRGHILVIDDELGIRVGCERALRSEGYQVDTAADGEEGLQRIEENGYDLILLDVMMPGIGGIEMLERISILDPMIVCVVITGYATVELAVQAIKKGAYDFIAKPFDSETLLLTVNQGLEKRSLSLQAQRLAELEAEAHELARQKAALEHLDRVKSTFTLTVAHELRAPVAAIQSYLRLILDGYIAPEDQRKYLERAERRAEAQLELINDLLYLARLQDPDIQPEQEPVALDGVLGDVLDAMTANAAQKRIEITSTVDPTIPVVNMNARHAKQLWTNLISNAIKYTPEGGAVQVSLHVQGKSLVGAVSDTGMGIPADEVDLIFEEFYRSKAAKAQTQMGTGLGLAIVRRILQTYGGSIEVTSKPGEGSTFRFHLPIGAG